jgi:hypothetical protein
MSSNETTAAMASLEDLHDIVLADPVSWWPPAPGWYVVSAVAVGLAIHFAIRALRRYRRNAYRRDALAMLHHASDDPSSLISKVAVLLKRTALSAFPREQVASLTGEAWLDFLDRTGATKSFSQGAGRVLGGGQYGVDPLNESERAELVRAAGSWIRSHRAEG